MTEKIDPQAQAAIQQMATAAKTLRDAIAASLPVAPTQLLTVQIPGQVINYNDYYYNPDEIAFTPLKVRINEARLVDSMLPVAKISMGNTGRSVSRSYQTVLDLLVPVEASVSGLIAGNSTEAPTGQRAIIKDRYDAAMRYLKSADEADGVPQAVPSSKLNKYVEKQAEWTKAVELYAKAQKDHQEIYGKQYPQSKEGMASAREAFNQWIQAHGRDFKATIQARYMDWVVHGYKFNVEFNFGIVDISSGMKRVEASKEAIRNLVIVGEDGYTEYNQVRLEPSDWASHVRDKVRLWNAQHAAPTPAEIKAEIKRLKNLLISHKALQNTVNATGFRGVLPKDDPAADKVLQDAYAATYSDVYKGVDARMKAKETGSEPPRPSDDTFKNLKNAQETWRKAASESNQKAIGDMQENNKKDITGYLDLRIATLESEIRDLESQLPKNTTFIPQVLAEDGTAIEGDEILKNPELNKAPETEPTKEKPSPWTKISAKVSMSSTSNSSSQSASESGVAARGSWGLWCASGGVSHAQSSSRSASSMSNLEVEIAMECMVVNIERPWLHGELFSDPDLDVGKAFDVSPGAKQLLDTANAGQAIDAKYEQFPSYPTAFVIASNVELNFAGDTQSLEQELEASKTEANVSVGWGPFAVSGSHKQSKSSSKTRTESTATGMKISLQAPQIIGWVQTLLPALPRPPAGPAAFRF